MISLSLEPARGGPRQRVPTRHVQRPAEEAEQRLPAARRCGRNLEGERTSQRVRRSGTLRSWLCVAMGHSHLHSQQAAFCGQPRRMELTSASWLRFVKLEVQLHDGDVVDIQVVFLLPEVIRVVLHPRFPFRFPLLALAQF